MVTCYFCGKGILEDKKVTVDFRWGNKLIVIEEVPAKVCNECGERYYSAEISKEMEKIAHRREERKNYRGSLGEITSSVFHCCMSLLRCPKKHRNDGIVDNAQR